MGSAFGAIWEDPKGGFIKYVVKRASKQDQTLHMERKLHVILYFRAVWDYILQKYSLKKQHFLNWQKFTLKSFSKVAFSDKKWGACWPKVWNAKSKHSNFVNSNLASSPVSWAFSGWFGTASCKIFHFIITQRARKFKKVQAKNSWNQ